MVLAPPARPQRATGRRVADCGTLHTRSETLIFLSRGFLISEADHDPRSVPPGLGGRPSSTRYFSPGVSLGRGRSLPRGR